VVYRGEKKKLVFAINVRRIVIVLRI